MRIVFPKEMNEIDNYCNLHIGLETISIMNNAADAICNFIISNFKKDSRILAICGGGNNGGDGLVTISKLHKLGYLSNAFILGEPNTIVKNQMDMFSKLNIPLYKDNLEMLLDDSDIILDCIFGTGFRDDVPLHVENYISKINESGKHIISVDIASGIYADSGMLSNIAIKANTTLVLSNLKPGNVIYPGREYCGNLVVCDIGIPNSVINMFSNENYYIDNSFDLKLLIKERKKDTHKGDYGKVGIIAGSRGMTGAALLCAESALRSGAGLVYLFSPSSLMPIYEASLKEVVKIEVGKKNDDCFLEKHADEIISRAKSFDTIIIGPGLGSKETTKKFVRKVISKLGDTDIKIVLDADGINSFIGHLDQLKAKQIVITPHYGEYLRLISNESKGRIADAGYFNKNNIITVLKGASTITASKDGFTINGTGNPGMAVAGSGDVLCGIVGAFAVNMPLYDAARYGALVHGLCGDVAKSIYGEQSMISSDIIKALPEVLNIYK